MRTLTLSAIAVVALSAGVTANAISTHPPTRHGAAAGGALEQTITDLQPSAYWPLNGTDADTSGNGDPLVARGAGAAVGHSSSSPAGATGGSVRFDPSSRQAGQYLRTTARPVAPGTRGTVVVWFRLTRALPGWTQTLIADNGASTGWGAGLFVNPQGRLVVADSSATVYSAPGAPDGNNFCRPGSCPHVVTAPLNDGQWHMAAFVDQYNIGTGTVAHDGWKPSLLYVDGQLVDSTIEGTLLNLAGGTDRARLLVGAGQRSQAATLGKWSGNIAHVALFDRLLTAGQVSAIWQAGS